MRLKRDVYRNCGTTLEEGKAEWYTVDIEHGAMVGGTGPVGRHTVVRAPVDAVYRVYVQN